MIVAQPTPNARAIHATAASREPICSNAHCRARSVKQARGAIAGWVSVQVRLGHNACTHCQIRLCQHNTTGRSATGRSRTHTGRRSFARATAPHSGQPTRSAVISISNSNSPPTSAAASNRNPPNPNSAATTEPVTSPSTWGSLLVITWS
jgi:hypothetical protein